MSSNIQIEKTCEFCHQQYTARTLFTRYCSHSCNRKAYKANKRAEKIQGYISTKENIGKQVQVTTMADLKEKNYLNINDVCTLLNISRGTVFRWIKDGVLVTYQHRQKHIIHRKNIEKIFNHDSKSESSKWDCKNSAAATKKR